MVNVTAVLVTRGNVDMNPVVNSLPAHWPVLVYDNTRGPQRKRVLRDNVQWLHEGDLSVYGRYWACNLVETPLVYVQDDDCVIQDPQAIVDACDGSSVVCNMPPQFRHDFYREHALVGFGACFPATLPGRVFSEFATHVILGGIDIAANPDGVSFFRRTCDVVFTALSPRTLIDIPYRDREFASDPDRMWRQPQHVAERARMLELALTAKKAA